LSEKWRIDSIRGKIIELLEKWTWIDKTLKEKIKLKISSVFEKYSDQIEWSLRMKSARYMEDRDCILKLDTTKRKNSSNIIKWTIQKWWDSTKEIQEIWWKPCYKTKKDWKRCVMRWSEELLGNFDEIEEIQEIWWMPCFRAKKSKKRCVILWTEQQWERFEWINKPRNIWWKPCFEVKKDWKWCVMRWSEQQWEW
jgi:hypothetical protein